MSPHSVIELRGSHRDIGWQHGRARQERIHAFLDDRLARINAVVPQPMGLTALAPTLRAYREVIGGVMPQMVDEIDGLAQGAQISADAALLLQLRREITGYRRIAAGGDCTTLTTAPGGEPLLAQTIDLNGAMAPELSLLRIVHSASGRQVLMVSFTGLIGYLGMNDRGLAIGLNLLLAADWRPGIPGYMAIRYLLDQADNVDQALALLRRLPLASSRAFTLCDMQRSVVVECLPGQVHELPSTVRAHTNHFLSPELAQLDQINPFAKTSSMRRLDACHRWLQLRERPIDAESVFELFAMPPVFVAPSDDVRREATVAAVVMQPTQGVLQLRTHPTLATAMFRVAPDSPQSTIRSTECLTS